MIGTVLIHINDVFIWIESDRIELWPKWIESWPKWIKSNRIVSWVKCSSPSSRPPQDIYTVCCWSIAQTSWITFRGYWSIYVINKVHCTKHLNLWHAATEFMSSLFCGKCIIDGIHSKVGLRYCALRTFQKKIDLGPVGGFYNLKCFWFLATVVLYGAQLGNYAVKIIQMTLDRWNTAFSVIICVNSHP